MKLFCAVIYIQDSSTKACDLNANTDSEVSGDGDVFVPEEALSVQVPRLDLKNASDGDKWEGNFCPLIHNILS
mgnify:CR=1 FL=1